jgi:hypothetical protein
MAALLVTARIVGDGDPRPERIAAFRDRTPPNRTRRRMDRAATSGARVCT